MVVGSTGVVASSVLGFSGVGALLEQPCVGLTLVRTATRAGLATAPITVRVPDAVTRIATVL